MTNTNYTRFSNQKTEPKRDTIQNGVPAVETIVEEVPEMTTKIGVVDNCYMLNVRKEPNVDANIICVIKVSDTVEIIEDESTDEFYKVCTAAGATGFCMKKYIKVE